MMDGISSVFKVNMNPFWSVQAVPKSYQGMLNGIIASLKSLNSTVKFQVWNSLSCFWIELDCSVKYYKAPSG